MSPFTLRAAPTKVQDLRKRKLPNEFYQIEIPPQMNCVQLKVKETKVDLPIFRRPGCPTDQPRNQMKMLRGFYVKPAKAPNISMVLIRYHK
jgi:hypothetical protein